MRVIVMTALFMLLTACASAPKPASGTGDARFQRIAEEWQGAHINDMIRVWGDPRLVEQFDDKGGAGRATWVVFGQYERRARCEASANFDAKGLIHDIEVVSVNCPPTAPTMQTGNWDIELLRRPSAQ